MNIVPEKFFSIRPLWLWRNKLSHPSPLNFLIRILTVQNSARHRVEIFLNILLCPRISIFRFIFILLAFGNHASVALHLRSEVKILFSEIKDLLISNEELLAQLHDLLTCHSDLILHVRNEQILVQLMDI